MFLKLHDLLRRGGGTLFCKNCDAILDAARKGVLDPAAEVAIGVTCVSSTRLSCSTVRYCNLRLASSNCPCNRKRFSLSWFNCDINSSVALEEEDRGRPRQRRRGGTCWCNTRLQRGDRTTPVRRTRLRTKPWDVDNAVGGWYYFAVRPGQLCGEGIIYYKIEWNQMMTPTQLHHL